MPSTSTTPSARERSASRVAGRAGVAGVVTARVPAGRRVSAGVAQLVERQPSKLNVASSSLVSRSVIHSVFGRPNPKTIDSAFGRPSPEAHVLTTALVSATRSTSASGGFRPAVFCSGFVGGGSSGSLVSRCFAHLAQLVEHVLGKDEVTSSILVVGSKRLRHAAPLLPLWRAGGRAFPRLFAVATVGCGDSRGRG
jgi:hypothetical protein